MPFGFLPILTKTYYVFVSKLHREANIYTSGCYRNRSISSPSLYFCFAFLHRSVLFLTGLNLLISEIPFEFEHIYVFYDHAYFLLLCSFT